jgi:lysophospholipase L1-like esterase
VRSRRALLWKAPLTLALVVGAVLATGMVLALTRSFGERLTPATAPIVRPPPTGNFRIVALGDSITYGSGDAGRGYAARVSESLRRRGLPVTLRNVAVPGADSDDLLAQLKGALLAEIADAHLVLVSIGGNDLTHSLRRDVPEPSTSASMAPELEAAVSTIRSNLSIILARLRSANPTAPIRVVGLYNPFEILPSAEAEARAQLQSWNAALETATHPHRDVLAVPIADLFDSRPDRLAPDHFHPGPKGHALIADRILSTLPDW